VTDGRPVVRDRHPRHLGAASRGDDFLAHYVQAKHARLMARVEVTAHCVTNRVPQFVERVRLREHRHSASLCGEAAFGSLFYEEHQLVHGLIIRG
jgi:hypothetical protein